MIPESLVSGDDLEEMLSIASLTPPGDLIEVGVYRGGSAYRLAQLAAGSKRRLYLCDTFTGIPYSDPEWDAHKVGDFSDVNLDIVKDDLKGFEFFIHWVIGTFPKSWVGPDRKFAFAHLDCDQYQSVKEASEWLIPRMVPDGVIWFDDVDRLKGATKAAEEVFGGRLHRHLSHAYVRIT